jgi:hypothetical protein
MLSSVISAIKTRAAVNGSKREKCSFEGDVDLEQSITEIVLSIAG